VILNRFFCSLTRDPACFERIDMLYQGLKKPPHRLKGLCVSRDETPHVWNPWFFIKRPQLGAWFMALKWRSQRCLPSLHAPTYVYLLTIYLYACWLKLFLHACVLTSMPTACWNARMLLSMPTKLWTWFHAWPHPPPVGKMPGNKGTPRNEFYTVLRSRRTQNGFKILVSDWFCYFDGKKDVTYWGTK
jgi:hypothetical protein